MIRYTAGTLREFWTLVGMPYCLAFDPRGILSNLDALTSTF
jgi:hypothetical protein